jgi:hypothetical protein
MANKLDMLVLSISCHFEQSRRNRVIILWFIVAFDTLLKIAKLFSSAVVSPSHELLLAKSETRAKHVRSSLKSRFASVLMPANSWAEATAARQRLRTCPSSQSRN